MSRKDRSKITVTSVVVGITHAAVIAFQNLEVVETKLLLATVTMFRAAMLFVTLVVGFVCGILTSRTLNARAREISASGEANR